MDLSSFPVDDDLVESWAIALRAERKSARTLVIYTSGVRKYTTWCADRGLEVALARRTFEAYLADLADSGLADATIAVRHMSVRSFSAWYAAEHRTDDALILVKGPKVGEKVVQPLSEAELAALFRACQGIEFVDRRDEAIARFIAESGVRASGSLSMTVDGTSLKSGKALVIAKGGDQYLVGFGPQTARALDRYLRLRRAHRLADTPAFWLGDRGSTFGYPGLYKALAARAEAAGIEDFYIHRLRHTLADRWLDKGGSEGGLMAIAGWKSRKMVDRYARARARTRALQEAQHLNLGDI